MENKNKNPSLIKSTVIGFVMSGVVFAVLYGAYDLFIKDFVDDFTFLDYEQSSVVGFVITYLVALFSAVSHIRIYTEKKFGKVSIAFLVKIILGIISLDIVVFLILVGAFLFIMKDFNPIM